MMMQWFINEVRERFEKVNQRIEGLANMTKEGDVHPLNERVTKLEGEIRAMKARIGKNNKNKDPEPSD